ncbi:unnamed protein product [Gongylonema pulchrum]|uniref:Type II toxin-antitoxin system RelE/ParE family toxin n=1 Tax=Gongylonema pulchrum TaxID=637853 RepID=A0A183E510_9BILA|nr:unnamed protein product [Gongylonema pulchrum]
MGRYSPNSAHRCPCQPNTFNCARVTRHLNPNPSRLIRNLQRANVFEENFLKLPLGPNRRLDSAYRFYYYTRLDDVDAFIVLNELAVFHARE